MKTRITALSMVLDSWERAAARMPEFDENDGQKIAAFYTACEGFDFGQLATALRYVRGELDDLVPLGDGTQLFPPGWDVDSDGMPIHDSEEERAADCARRIEAEAHKAKPL